MFRRLFAIAAGVLLVGAAPAAAVNASQPGIVSNVPAQGTPAVLDGVVNSVVQVGGRIVVGGSFTKVMQANGHVLARTDIFSFDPSTGLVDPAFDPPIANGLVSTLSAGPDGQTVFAGGTFDTVNGQPEKRLVKLNLADGSIVSAFQPALMGSWVEDSDVRGSTLYIAGAITSVNGVPRGRLAAVDATTGAVDPDLAVDFTDKRAGKLRVAHFDISPDGTKLVATGTFTKVDGLDRPQIAVIDLSTTPASVSSWQTDAFAPPCAAQFDTYIRDVSFAPDGSYFVVADTGAWFGGPAAHVLCDSVQRWEAAATGPGQQPTWVDYTGGDSLTQVAATGAAVYVGGHQRYLNNPFRADAAGAGAVSRMGIAALDPVNGLPYTWNPGRYPRGSGVWAFLGTPDGLWVGSDTDYVDFAYHPRLAFLPVAGGRAVPAATPGTLPGDLYTVGGGLTPVKRTFDGTTAGPPANVTGAGLASAKIRGAFMLSGRLYVAWSDGHMDYRTFDGAVAGTPKPIDLHKLTAADFPVSKLTGMFFADGRLYYTVSGNAHLFWRWFEPQSRIVGAERFVASGVADGLDWTAARGITMAGGRLYYLRGGTLYAMDFAAGAPVPGTEVAISGTATGDGQSWGGRGMFVNAP
jgi:Domain of unknown function (DUF5122) beta-propeller